MLGLESAESTAIKYENGAAMNDESLCPVVMANPPQHSATGRGRHDGCTIVPLHSPKGYAYIVADLPRENLDEISDWKTL